MIDQVGFEHTVVDFDGANPNGDAQKEVLSELVDRIVVVEEAKMARVRRCLPRFQRGLSERRFPFFMPPQCCG